MKNLIFVCAISTVFSTSCFCQLVGVRPNVGGNFANMASQNATGETNTGLNGGIGFDIALAESENGYPIRLSPEIFVRQNGSENFVNQSNIFNGFQSLDLTYVGIYMPLTFALGPDDGETVFEGVMIQLNTFLDYAVATDAIASNGQQVTNPVSGFTEKIDFGFGVNIQFHSGYGGIAIGYNWGLNNIDFINNVSSQIFAKNKGLFVNAVTTFKTDN